MTWWSLIFPMIIDIEMKCYTCIVNCLFGHFQPYFIHIVAVIFIGIGNQYTPRKLQTCNKSDKKTTDL